mmetsp:Transcript_49541/g.152911  ORF Transcript_49541/g.152911 Transcript_49541/m.152911 type:complete len:302 (+) Transcript_49541:3038-3943(+)
MRGERPGRTAIPAGCEGQRVLPPARRQRRDAPARPPPGGVHVHQRERQARPPCRVVLRQGEESQRLVCARVSDVVLADRIRRHRARAAAPCVQGSGPEHVLHDPARVADAGRSGRVRVRRRRRVVAACPRAPAGAGRRGQRALAAAPDPARNDDAALGRRRPCERRRQPAPPRRRRPRGRRPILDRLLPARRRPRPRVRRRRVAHSEPYRRDHRRGGPGQPRAPETGVAVARVVRAHVAERPPHAVAASRVVLQRRRIAHHGPLRADRRAGAAATAVAGNGVWWVARDEPGRVALHRLHDS